MSRVHLAEIVKIFGAVGGDHGMGLEVLAKEIVINERRSIPQGMALLARKIASPRRSRNVPFPKWYTTISKGRTLYRPQANNPVITRHRIAASRVPYKFDDPKLVVNFVGDQSV